jgi:energy-coupling factor transport system substrate-specific component
VKEKLLTAVIYLLTTGLGVFAYIYPLLETPNQAILSSNRQNELPIMMAMILALCSIVLIYEIQQYRLNTKLIALLGILIAINSTLRFIDLTLPVLGGFSPVFFLILISGYVFGGRMGFLMGSLTMLVSAMITGGVGPWLPNQMLTAGWVGLSAALAKRLVLLIHQENKPGELFILIIFGFLWGFLYGAITNLWFWPFLSGPSNQVFAPGAGFITTIKNYGIFYVATSLIWDATRAIGNVLLLIFFGKATIQVLRRFQKRFHYVQLGEDGLSQ